MKKLFNTNLNLESTQLMLLFLRLVIAGLMLTHGLPKLSGLMGPEPVQFGDPIGIGVTTSLVLTVFAEVGCSLLILFGLATRLAVLPLIFTMVIAVFVVHGQDAFSIKEMALHYLLVYAFLLFSGSGKYSIDHFISSKVNRRRR